MTNGETHEISRILGKLEAQGEERTRQMGVLFEKFDTLHGCVKQANARLEKMEPLVKAAYESGQDWKETKTRAKWIIAGMTAGGAGIGGSLATWWHKLTGL